MATPNTRQMCAIGSHQNSGSKGGFNWQCPDCQSADLVKLSLVYAAGTSAINGRSRGRGFAFAENGIGLSFSRTRASGKIQTQLSRMASPPHKKRYRYVIVTWLLGFYLALCIAAPWGRITPAHAAHLHQQFAFFSWMYCAFLVFVLGVLWRNNHVVCPRRYREWDRSFMCRRCGMIVRVESQP